MNSLDHRLDQHFRDPAAAPTPSDPGVEVVMAKGRRIRPNRTMAVASAGTMVVAALVVGSLAMLHRPQATLVPSQATDDPVALVQSQQSPRSDIPAATRVDTGITWTAHESTGANVSNELGWSAIGGGDSVYALGTAPVPKGQSPKSQMYRTTDGVTFTPTGPAFDPWISSLDDDGSRIYALGTAPTANDPTSFSYQIATSDDGAATWQTTPFPIDLATARSELGGVSSLGTQIVAGDGSVMAMINPVAFIDPSAVFPKDIDEVFGAVVTADGIDVYGPPTDLDAVAALVCPQGWPLKEGDPRSQYGDNSGGVDTVATVSAQTGLAGPGSWHCESPDGNSDTWVDPSQVHGDVVRTVPFEQLDISADSLKALRGEPRLFRSTDSRTWAEVSLPTRVDLHNGSAPQLLWAGDRYVFVVSTAADGLLLFTSTDGTTWTQGRGPTRLTAPTVAVLPDGSLLALALSGGEVTAGHSTDDSTWTYVSLDGLLQLDPTWRANPFRIASGSLGTAVIVTAQRDIVAAQGGLELRHDHFTLRYADSQGTLQLLDSAGTLLDTRQSWGPASNDGGWIQLSQNYPADVIIVDPTTGEQVDVFRQAETDTTWNEFYNSSEYQQTNADQQPTTSWVLDTVDGTGWAATPLAQLGIGASNSYPSTAVATATSLQYGFLVSKADGSVAAATMVGTRG